MNEQARAWQAWLQTDDADSCLKGEASGRYLENRLWAAFMAGFDAGEKASKVED
jgi:hypothetical protein